MKSQNRQKRDINMIDYKYIISNFLRNTPHSETDYQERIVSFIVSLGWGWTNDEINQQLSISIGSTKRVIPDIVVFYDKYPQFVIEVKSAHHTKIDKDIEQLTSYMKQLEVKVGIYFGEKIIVYYKEFGNNSTIVNILEVSLNADDKNWADFFNLFHKDRYSMENIYQYYESVKQRRNNEAIVKNHINQLVSENGFGIIHKAVHQYLKSRNLDSTLIETILSAIQIQVNIRENKNNEIFNSTIITESPEPSKKSTQHKNRSNARFSINGKGEYLIGELARNIVTIISQREDMNFAKIKSIFNTVKTDLVVSVDDLAAWETKHKGDHKKDRRLFKNRPIESNDGIVFYVTAGWGIDNIDKIIEVGREWGLTIERIK